MTIIIFIYMTEKEKKFQIKTFENPTIPLYTIQFYIGYTQVDMYYNYSWYLIRYIVIRKRKILNAYNIAQFPTLVRPQTDLLPTNTNPLIRSFNILYEICMYVRIFGRCSCYIICIESRFCWSPYEIKTNFL